MLRIAMLVLTSIITACASTAPKPGFGDSNRLGGIDMIELTASDLRERPIRIAPNGDFEYPGFSQSARRWWENFYYMDYKIDPTLPKFCTGRFTNSAAEEVAELFKKLEQSPPKLPRLDRITIISHAIHYDVKIVYFGGSTNYGPVYPNRIELDQEHLRNDWQHLSNQVLELFGRSGMTVNNWKPITARVTHLKCH